jgi:hypothetical protein
MGRVERERGRERGGKLLGALEVILAVVSGLDTINK